MPSHTAQSLSRIVLADVGSKHNARTTQVTRQRRSGRSERFGDLLRNLLRGVVSGRRRARGTQSPGTACGARSERAGRGNDRVWQRTQTAPKDQTEPERRTLRHDHAVRSEEPPEQDNLATGDLTRDKADVGQFRPVETAEQSQESAKQSDSVRTEDRSDAAGESAGAVAGKSNDLPPAGDSPQGSNAQAGQVLAGGAQASLQQAVSDAPVQIPQGLADPQSSEQKTPHVQDPTGRAQQAAVSQKVDNAQTGQDRAEGIPTQQGDAEGNIPLRQPYAGAEGLGGQPSDDSGKYADDAEGRVQPRQPDASGPEDRSARGTVSSNGRSALKFADAAERTQPQERDKVIPAGPDVTRAVKVHTAATVASQPHGQPSPVADAAQHLRPAVLAVQQIGGETHGVSAAPGQGSGPGGAGRPDGAIGTYVRQDGSYASDPQVNLDRLAQVVHAAASRRRSVAHLRLHPPELGEVRAILRLSADRLQLRLQVGTDAARDLLLGGLDRLRESLQQNGITLDRLSVQVTQQPQQQTGRDGQGWSSTGQSGQSFGQWQQGQFDGQPSGQGGTWTPFWQAGGTPELREVPDADDMEVVTQGMLRVLNIWA